MSELNKASSGADPDSSASGVSNEDQPSSGGDSNNAAYDKLLKEKQNHARANLDLKAKLLAYEAKEKKRVENELLEKDQHTKLIDIQKKEIEDLNGKITKHEDMLINSRKNSQFLQELKKLGLNENDANKKAALKLFDNSIINVDSETGTVIGADLAAKSFYDEYNHLGLFGKQSVGVNQNAPQGVISKLTLDEWKKLSPEDKIKRRGELENNYK